jgi:hypothetical protein
VEPIKGAPPGRYRSNLRGGGASAELPRLGGGNHQATAAYLAVVGIEDTAAGRQKGRDDRQGTER